MKPITLLIHENDGLRTMEFKELTELGVKHRMTSRDYNLGLISCGDEAELRRQYQELKKVMDLPLEVPIRLLKQVHSAKVIFPEDAPDEQWYAGQRLVDGFDGFVSKVPKETTLTTFADCVPVVIVDEGQNLVANLHSGWKGTLQGIGPECLKTMMAKYGTNPKDVKVFLGPHIGFADFEVTHEVTAQFISRYQDLLAKKEFIKKQDEDHDRIDLNKVLEADFKSLGVAEDHIYAAFESTVADPDLFHSFRRDGKNFGIMGLLVVHP